MRRIGRFFSLLAPALLCATFASAQTGLDVGVGFGASFAPAAKTGIDTNLNSCALGTLGCQSTPNLNSFMLGFRMDLMAWEKYGFGFQYNTEVSRNDYVTFPSTQNFSYALQSRVALWDINGILAPVKSERLTMKLSGGIGGAQIRFYESGQSTSALVGTQRYTQLFGTSNKFQVHGGAGVQWYPTGGSWFIRPEFDIHYVHDFDQFGRNAVIRGTVWLGYTLGR